MNIFKLLRRIYILRILKKLIYNPLRTFRMFKSIMVLNRIIAKDELVVGFYDRYLVHYTFSAPIIEKLSASGKKVLYLVADKEHPIFLRKYAHVYPILIDRDFELLLKAVKLKLLITPASSFHVHSKSNKTKVAYLFHSPVSMHYVYDDNAFDAYDIFFAVGPHHKREYELLSKLRGWEGKQLVMAGSPKIDDMAVLYNSKSKKTTTSVRKVMLAPSWGEKNILKHHGKAIISDLLEMGLHVVLRPHKHSFDYDLDVIDEIEKKYISNDMFELDKSIGYECLLDCDCLISDWSGVAYEFSFSTNKPVVFIDSSKNQKIQSIINRTIGLPPMEDVARYQVGLVSGVTNIAESVKLALFGVSCWNDKIQNGRKCYLYNPGNSSEKISEYIINNICPAAL